MAIAFVAQSTAVSSANGATSFATPLARPTGLVDGQFMVMALAVQTNTTGADATFTVPAGWTLIQQLQDDDSTTRVKLGLWYKYASGESSTYATSWSSTATFGRAIGAILAYSGVHPTTPIVGTEKGIAKTATTTTARTTPTITTAASRRILSFFADPYASGTAFPSAADTLRVALGQSNIELAVTDSNGMVAAGSISRTATANTSSNTAVTAIIALNPDPDPPVVAGSVGTTQWVEIDYRSSTSPSGSTSWAISPSADVVLLSNGYWMAPMSADSAKSYTVTVTDTVSGISRTGTANVPRQAAARNRRRRWNGTAWV